MTRTIGDYAIVKQIGQGSLGSVYLAEHRFLKRCFALKILPPELSSDSGFVERFEKEMTTLSALNHPHIVKIHNVCLADGYYFLVTDCIVDEKGEVLNLAQFLNEQEKQLSEQEIYEIACQVASALDYAHQIQIEGTSIAHHGIKLNNILVKKNASNPHVFLSDFGLTRVIGTSTILTNTYKNVAESLGLRGVLSSAKAAAAAAAAPSNSDRFSKLHLSFLQNYLFLAPEQKMGDLGRIDTKADCYAFGVLVYYLIMHEFPEGFFQMPSEKFPHFKGNWDGLIKACLHPYPELRPSSLKEAMNTVFASFKKSASLDLHPDSAKKLQPVIRPQKLERPTFEKDPGAIFQTEKTVARYTPQPIEHADLEPIQTEMVIIPAGSYFRGSNHGGRDEMPRHVIKLLSFAIDIHPVTNEQFVRFLEAMGGEKDVNNSDLIRLRDSRIKRVGGKLMIESGYARHPVVGVTWYGAVAYAKWVGKRLPTEAEWEIAASGGKEEYLYPTGQMIERSQANFFSSDTTAVMSYPPQGFGLYDMAGNVYEWCQDWYEYHYYDISVQEPDNPKGPLQGVYRVLRGGCWKSLKEDMRCAHRHRNNPGTMTGTYGFRCAADVS